MVWRVIRRRIVYVVVFSMALFSLVAFRRRETVTIVAGVSNSDLVDCNTKESQFFVEQLVSIERMVVLYSQASASSPSTRFEYSNRKH